MSRRWLLAGLLALQLGAATATDDEATAPWQEQAVELPSAPRQEDLLPFVVSAATGNRFFVDARSLRVDGDGVVRYVLVVETPGGARNVSFEGMRCETRERRIYASGRADGSWSPSRNRGWERIREAVANRHHAALFTEYFCPIGVIARSREEALSALRRGVHPLNERFGN